MARAWCLHVSNASTATQNMCTTSGEVSRTAQEPPLDAGPTVDDNIRPALQRIQDMLREYEQVCT